MEPDLTEFYEQNPPGTLGYFEEAESTAQSAVAALAPAILNDPPLPLDTINDARSEADARVTQFSHLTGNLILYYRENGSWLRGCKQNITAAIDSGDEEFFVRLADLILKRPTYRGRSHLAALAFRSDSDPRPKKDTFQFRFIIASKWIPWGLWLMPDPVACAFVQKFGGAKIADTNFTKIRQELKVAQHPAHPAASYSVKGIPILRKGWRNAKS